MVVTEIVLVAFSEWNDLVLAKIRVNVSSVVSFRKSSRSLCSTHIQVAEGILDEKRQSQNIRVIEGIEFGQSRHLDGLR